MPLFTPWANRLIEATLGAQVDPQSVWIGLSTTVPAPDGTNWTEVADAQYGGYARVTLAGLMGGAAGGLAANTAPVEFPVPSVGGAVIAAVGLFTDPVAGPGSAGRLFRAVQPAVQIIAGRRPKFDPNTLTLSAG